jgi:ketosteroid isomerase-like protein
LILPGESILYKEVKLPMEPLEYFGACAEGGYLSNKHRIHQGSCLLISMASMFAIIFACSRGQSKTDVINAYERAFNAGQVDSLLSLFSDDAQVEFVGMGPVLEGRKEVADKARYDSTLDGRMAIEIRQVKNDTVFATAIENNAWLKRGGLPPNVYSSVMFVISRGKITGLQAELSDSSVASVNEIMQNLIPWAQANEPDKLNELLPQGSFSYSVKSANLSLRLLEDWQTGK